MQALKTIAKGLGDVVFPHVCEICGAALPSKSQFICGECITNRFELARLTRNPNSEEIILPENVAVQFALWKFDKGGYLQDLLHSLKYHRLYGIGEDLGKALAARVMIFEEFKQRSEMILIPVPLHKMKEKKRGYNQAYYIAKGVGETMSIPILSRGGLLRVKNTKTQTGFSLEKRKENISKAFQVHNKSDIKGRICIIVDDVFTTGATTFELADELGSAGASKIMIITVAEA